MGSMVLPSQAYEVKLAPHAVPFSVLRFSGFTAISRLYRYEVEFTSPIADIPMAQLLGRPTKFTTDPIDPNADYLRKMFGENVETFSDNPPALTIHGIATQLDQFETSADQTRYKLVIEPRMADLARGVKSRLFQKQSAQEIFTDTLRHYGLREGVDFRFELRAQYKRHEYITQYHETTMAFIQRIAAAEGIWFRFEHAEDREVIVFGDDLDAYASSPRTVPLRSDTGLESVARDDKTTNAVDSRWGEHYETPEEGQRIAQQRHEAHLSQQITFGGKGNVFALEVGEVLRLDRNPVDAPHDLFVVSVESSEGRSQAYSNTFSAIPSDRVWRTPLEPGAQPVISGILPARVTSLRDYTRAYLTPEGWYVMPLPCDLDACRPGGTSRPERLARPYSGDDHGHHFPPIDGAEVAIISTTGSPDRPVIVGTVHDSLHLDLVNNLNHTRKLIRTAAHNEMHMEDKEGNEHMHLTTPFQTDELNLAHRVDGERKDWGQDADATLRQALDLMRSLNDAATAAKASLADMEQQRALIEQKLMSLQKPVIVASAPESVSIASGQHM